MSNQKTEAQLQTRPLLSLFDLSGQIALVTGGSRGLGLQMAEALGEFGALPVLVARKEEELKRAVAYLESKGIRSEMRVCDMQKADFAPELVDEVHESVGKIDILINNAGASWGADAVDHPPEAWHKVINLNVTALFELSRHVARTSFIERRKGAIISMASVEAFRGHSPFRPGTVAYNTSKGAVVSMTRALAAEWGQYGIRVNAIAPGYFPSNMTKGLLATYEEELLDEIPLRKLGNDNDLKGLALLLASEAGGHISGQTILVDGGATAM